MQTLLDQIGGEDSLEKVIRRFHDKLYADPLTARFFAHTDREKLDYKQHWFLTMVLCGTCDGVAYYMQAAHARLVENMGLADEHFTRTIELFAETLQEANVPKNVATEILELAENLRAAVLGTEKIELHSDEERFPVPPEL